MSFVLLECALSVPFWGIGALAQAHVIPDHVLFRASWSLTPMMAAAILVYRGIRAAGVRRLFRRIVDYARIEAKIWYLAVFLVGPIIVFAQYALALRSGQQVPAPHFTLLVPISFIGFFLVAYAEELGWTVYTLHTLLPDRNFLPLATTVLQTAAFANFSWRSVDFAMLCRMVERRISVLSPSSSANPRRKTGRFRNDSPRSVSTLSERHRQHEAFDDGARCALSRFR